MKERVDEITRAFEEDQKSLHTPTPIGALPLSYDSIGNNWLTEVLCTNTPGAKVIDHRLDKRDDGSSNRRRIFVTYNDAGRAAGLPSSLFCKASHDLPNRIALGISGAAYCESVFYNGIRPHLTFEGPRCYFARVDSNTCNSLVMLEDLSISAQTFCNHQTEMTRTRAESQVRLLATVHSACYDKPETNAVLRKLPSWYDYFIGTQGFGMESGSNNGFLAAKDVIPNRLYQRYEEIWPATVRSAAMHNNLPTTLCHGDVHLKNWYVAGNGEMGITDWQCCHRGNWSRDFAYTVSTALKIEDRRHWERDLLNLYLSQVEENGGPKITFNEAWTLYRSQLLSALTWWTVTLTPPPGLPDMQPRDITLEFIERISTAIDDLDSLDALTDD